MASPPGESPAQGRWTRTLVTGVMNASPSWARRGEISTGIAARGRLAGNAFTTSSWTFAGWTGVRWIMQSSSPLRPGMDQVTSAAVAADRTSYTGRGSLSGPIAATKASWALSRTITVPERIEPRPAAPGKLRIAFLIYRGNPRCGGQGVYTRHLTRELVALGHSVEVFAGPPWPELDEGVGFTPVPGLDLYRDPDPFRVPARSEFRSLADVTEFAVMMSAGFGEPLAYSMRLAKVLDARRGEFDIVHDNQCMGPGVLRLHRRGWPLLDPLELGCPFECLPSTACRSIT